MGITRSNMVGENGKKLAIKINTEDVSKFRKTSLCISSMNFLGGNFLYSFSFLLWCFYTCLSVILFTGGFLPQCMLGYTHPWADTPLGRHPTGQTPLGRQPPLCRHLLGRHPPGQTPSAQCMLGYTPLPSACWDTPPAQCMLRYTVPSACRDRHGYCCGRYASYWNAFLLNMHSYPLQVKSWIIFKSLYDCRTTVPIIPLYFLGWRGWGSVK